MHDSFEPFRTRVIEPIKRTTRAHRLALIAAAGFNLYALDSEDVQIDLLTDSGLCALSSHQTAAMMQGDESYAGSSSYRRLEARIQEIFGFEHIVPTHQGRAAERILLDCLAQSGDLIPCNMHFDTMRANCMDRGITPADFPADEFWDFESAGAFKGDMNCEALEQLLASPDGERVPFILLTITNNVCGDQPVSMANIRAVREIARRYGKPLYFDCCRFAQNAWLIRTREREFRDTPLNRIVREMFSYADGCIFSAKKDALAHIGGFFGTRCDETAKNAKHQALLAEGFITYGGMTGRDMEIIAVGLSEVMDEEYLQYRIDTTRYLFERLQECGIPVVGPPGGHAVYIDAARILSHLEPAENPGQALAVEIYVEGGVRSTRISIYPEHGPMVGRQIEFVRLALPSRVYSTKHLDFTAASVAAVARRASSVNGLKGIDLPKLLPGFLARYEQVCPVVL